MNLKMKRLALKTVPLNVDKLFIKLSLGEYGRQRTSKKFHDLVLSLRSQNSRVLETIMFLALFSRRKVLVYFVLNLNIRNSIYFFAELSVQHFYFLRILFRDFLEIFENYLIVI